MSATGHALVGPSGYKVWSNCPRAVRLGLLIPDEESPYAEEGTIAHALCEKLLSIYKETGKRKWLKKDMASVVSGEDENGEPIVHKCPVEMQDAAQEYANKVIDDFEALRAKDPSTALMVEVEEDLSEWIPEGFGTSDAAIVSGNAIHIYDFKYGLGVQVSGRGNGQLRLYALGAYHELGFLYPNVEEVETTIVQPRLHWVSGERLTVKELLAWGETVKPLARAAFDGKGEYNPGEWCRAGFCKARDVCRARATKAVEGILAAIRAGKGDSLDPNLMGPEELNAFYDASEPFSTMVNDAKNRIFSDLQKGIAYPGFKLVAGRSSRDWDDAIATKKALQEKGYLVRDICEEPSLLSPSKLGKIVKKEDFEAIAKPHILVTQGRPALARADDPRPEYKPASAEEDFAGLIEKPKND